MDETAVFIEAEPKYIGGEEGHENIPIRCTRSDNRNLIDLVSAAISGTKLDLFSILTRKSYEKIENICKVASESVYLLAFNQKIR